MVVELSVAVTIIFTTVLPAIEMGPEVTPEPVMVPFIVTNPVGSLRVGVNVIVETLEGTKTLKFVEAQKKFGPEMPDTNSPDRVESPLVAGVMLGGTVIERELLTLAGLIVKADG